MAKTIVSHEQDQIKQKERSQPPMRKLPPEAIRALAEAEVRRNNHKMVEPTQELNGRGGQDPARFGDWEINGRAIDF